MRWQYTESYACCVVLISRAHSDERIYSEFRFCHFQSNTLGVTHTTDRNINTFLAPFNRLRKCIGSVNHIAADTIICSSDWREETLFFESSHSDNCSKFHRTNWEPALCCADGRRFEHWKFVIMCYTAIASNQINKLLHARRMHNVSSIVWRLMIT